MDKDWIEEQFVASKIKIKIGRAVLKLVEAWDVKNLNNDETLEAFNVASKLVRGHSLLAPSNYTWVDASPGQIKVADAVRVKTDAFDGELGITHNGREGVIVAIRSGDVIFRSTDDKKPQLDGTHYSPYHLQKRIG
jgi:hypothetical protein